MTTNLRPLVVDDVPTCAAIHKRAFPGFFLSELGEPFLREFYRAFVGDPAAIAAVAPGPDGSIQGVVVGTTEPRGFFKRLVLRRWWAFGLTSLLLVLRRPRYLPRLVRAVSYRGDSPIELFGALLSSICVDPGAPPGTGRSLLAAFMEAVAQRDIDGAYLTTDADDNERVNRFYQQSGWHLRGSYETPEGRRMNAYQWSAILTERTENDS